MWLIVVLVGCTLAGSAVAALNVNTPFGKVEWVFIVLIAGIGICCILLGAGMALGNFDTPQHHG